MSKGLRILNLYVENFKRIKVVDITPEGDVIPLVGKNEQGKTSTLDAISAVLYWRAVSKGIPQPVHDGAEKGCAIIDLGDFIVHRTFNSSGTTNLKITTKTGDIVPKPQGVLDGWMGDLSLDPLEFSRKDPKEQRELIASLLKRTIGLDISSFEADYHVAYDERTTHKRDLVRLRGQLEALKAPTDSDPTDEQDIGDLTRQMSDRMQEIQQYDSLEAKLVDAEERAAKLETELLQAEVERISLRNQLEKLTVPDPIEEIQSQISSLEETNRRAREVKQYNALRDDLSSLKKDIDKCSATMELAQINKDEAIEAADLPVDGLGITEDGITIDDIPFSQCSAAQRLKTSMAIAMMANPTVRVILIRDGSLLDEDNMSIIEEMAGDNDFQLWIERVGTDEEAGVYIENGEVIN